MISEQDYQGKQYLVLWIGNLDISESKVQNETYKIKLSQNGFI